MTHDELQTLIKHTVRESVVQTLSSLGFDVDNPHEIQADLRYLNKTRKGAEFVSLRIKAALIASLVPTFLYLLWEVSKKIVKDLSS